MGLHVYKNNIWYVYYDCILLANRMLLISNYNNCNIPANSVIIAVYCMGVSDTRTWLEERALSGGRHFDQSPSQEGTNLICPPLNVTHQTWCLREYTSDCQAYNIRSFGMLEFRFYMKPHWESNPRPLVLEAHLLTTRPLSFTCITLKNLH